ncbi:uncharacterized protein LOC115221807 isoform X2 [Octopus sinensis]|uniref:Uncharacterized protein LOC115221807 isoform X2 n=2 Tax=Octopus sinensis TaxID=2607531 RepID=A0A7E6FG20_9MOLL|nr:uncharacterized protein LOC115221807 isoform X2 [Octopus sinensis]
MVSQEIQTLSDEQLRSTLVEYNVTVGPITKTTRKLYERKLARLWKQLPAIKLSSDEKDDEEEEEEEEIKQCRSSAFSTSTMKNMKGYAHVNKHSERKRPRVLHRKMSSTVSKISKANNLLDYSNYQYSQLEVPCDAHMTDCSTDVNPVSEDSQSTEESSVSKYRQSTANDTTSQNEWISNMQNKNIDFGNILGLTFKRPDKNCSGKVLQVDKPKTKLSWNVKSNSDVKNNLNNLNKDYFTEENISSQKHFDYSALQQPVTTIKGSDFVYGISPIPENVSGRYSFAVPRIAWKSLDKSMHTNLPYQTVSSLDKNCNPVRKMLPQYYNQSVDAAVISAENTREIRQHSTTNTGVLQQNKETNVSSRSQFSDYSTQFTSPYF